MTATNSSIERYLHDVGKALPCVRKTRRTLTEGLRQELAEFAESAPGASFEMLCATFGVPKEAAAQLLDGVNENDLRRARTKKRVLVSVLLCLLLCLAFYKTWQVREAQKIIDEGPVYIIEYPTTDVTYDGEVPDDVLAD